MTVTRPMIIEWDGTNLPSELSALPPGQYLVEPVNRSEGDGILASGLTDEEEQGIIDALAERDTGESIPFDLAMRELRESRSRR